MTDKADKTDETTPPTSSVSSVSRVSGGCSVLKDTAATDPVEGRAAVALLNHSGARLLPHRLRTVAVPRENDTAELRKALAILGFGAYAVTHLDTGKYRGQGIAVVEAALQATGELTC